MLYRTLLVSILAANVMAIALSIVARSPLNYALGPALLLFAWMWLTYEQALHRRNNDAMKAAKQQDIEIMVGYWTNRIYAVLDDATDPRLRLLKFTSAQPGSSKNIEMVTLEVWDAPKRLYTPEWLIDYAQMMSPASP